MVLAASCWFSLLQLFIQCNFNESMKNGGNKTWLIEIVKNTLILNKIYVHQKQKYQKINFSMHWICFKSRNVSLKVIDKLRSNQEKAETKLMLPVKHWIEIDQNWLMLMWSLSGCVDINLIFVSMCKGYKTLWQWKIKKYSTAERESHL